MEIVQQPAPEKKERRKINLRGSFVRRRKVLILTGMFVLLIVTGYLNFALNSNSTPVGGGGGTGQTMNSFAMLRQTRDTNRQIQKLALESIIASNNVTEAERSQATETKLALINTMEFETAAEGLIKGQGHQDAVVQKNNDNVNVLVRTQGNLTPNEVTQIQLIVDSVLGRTMNIENITVRPVN
ncbi:MAG: SpoIIIAH-like family protein [Firmicutes bacterium]|nr:SpoIIIAH-like family protein [Bacillota bacterium]